jgi:hypothetical protein
MDLNGDSDYEPAGHFSYGEASARHFVKLPDGSYGWGGWGPFAHTPGSPAGPQLYGIDDGLPDTTTTGGYGTYVQASTKYLDYYSYSSGFAHSAASPGSYRSVISTDGVLLPGIPQWAFRTPNYPYVWEGIPCSQNPGVCAGSTGYASAMSGNGLIDPKQNGGVGSWMLGMDEMSGMVWYQGANRSGLLTFLSMVSNHTQGDVTSETAGGSWVARGYYCSGELKGESGHTCAGVDGDHLSPEYQITCVPNCGGPGFFRSTTEPMIAIFNPADLNAVKNGTKTDYTVDPTSRIYPMDSNADIRFCLNVKPTQHCNGAWGGIARDPTNPHIIYALSKYAESATDGNFNAVIHVFRVSDEP